MKRRDFIVNTGLATGALVSAPYISKGKDIVKFMSNQQLGFGDNDSIIIIIELFGGNDGINTIIPIEDRHYSDYRSNIEILPQFAKRWGNSSLYMHPALVENQLNNGFMGLLEAGRLSVIEGVGYQNPNLSHFRSQEIWHSGIISNDPNVRLTEGWLGRYIANKLTNFPFEIPEHPIAISLEGTIPLLLKSKKGHMGIALNNINSFYELGSKTNPTDPARDGSDNFSVEHNFIHSIARQSAQYSSEIKKAFDNGKNEVDYSAGLAQKFKTIARLISGGLNTKVYYVGLSNFDSHVQQTSPLEPMSGQHPRLLSQLSSAISQFTEDALIQGFYKRVTGMTISEFGRRVYDNGSRGSDHGAASVMFVFGHNDGIKGGHLGNPTDLSNGVRGGNLVSRVEEDFRNIYTDFLKFRLGADNNDVYDVFKDNFVTEFGVLTQYMSSVEENIIANPGNELGVYPNPTTGPINIQFELKQTSSISLKAFSLNGEIELTIREGLTPAGIYNIPFTITHRGFYTISLKVGMKRYSHKLIVV
jgi:uncharacterized protein (DUF1501 family)